MKRLPRLTVYRATDGWRWNYRAANGRIMADSAEAYVERGKCLRAACQLWDGYATNNGYLRHWASDLPLARVVLEGRP